VDEAFGGEVITDTDEGVTLEKGIADEGASLEAGADEETRALQGLRLGKGLDI
jgi:hypothetical protein